MAHLIHYREALAISFVVVVVVHDDDDYGDNDEMCVVRVRDTLLVDMVVLFSYFV